MRLTNAAMMTAVALVGFPAAAASKGDPVAGAQAFAPCAVCHARSPSEGVKLGPRLFGVVGKKAATVDPKFSYSPALKGSTVTWTEANLDSWLIRPNDVVPGNRMFYSGMVDPVARANVVAYLKTLK